jgi:dihydrolipoamide dehydrogenase
MSGVYAIGDLVGEPMLEHKAASQAHVAVEVIAGQNRVFDPAAIAAVCFTEPEIVSAGLPPKEAEAAGHDPVGAIFPFQANGRARSMEAGDTGGFVRVVARTSRSSPESSPCPSRWAPGWRTWPGPSTSTGEAKS